MEQQQAEVGEPSQGQADSDPRVGQREVAGAAQLAGGRWDLDVGV